MNGRSLSLADVRNRMLALDPGEGGCWNWAMSKFRNGYGAAAFDGKQHLAHRLSYTVFVGPIPEGLEIDHLCRNWACVNPAHLEAVTHEVNNRRRQFVSTDGLVSPGKAALILGVSVKTILRWTADGRLPLAAHSAGGHRRYDLAHVEALAAERAA